MRTVYLKSGRRRPVQWETPLFLRDIQQDIPAGWCPSCGQMIYNTEALLCTRCESRCEDGKEECKPLPDLHTGAEPC